MPGKTCASRTQTSLLDLLRHRQVYPMGGEPAAGRFTRCPSSDRGPGLRAAHQHDRLSEGSRRVQDNHRADGFGTEPAAGDSPGEQRLERDHHPSQRAIGRALRHGQHRDRRQGHKNLCKPKANELARFAEAPPSLSNQAQDEYQRLMNNKSPKSKRK